MPNRRIAWQDGEARVQRWVGQWALGSEGLEPVSSEVLHESEQRSLHRLESMTEIAVDPEGLSKARAIVVKIHRSQSGRHPRRESIKRIVGYSPALREWQALVALHAARVPVPEPLAWGILPNGDALLVTEDLEGQGVTSILSASSPDERMEWIDRISSSIAKIHSAGFRHGDLHLGNLHARGDQVMILDVQRARPATGRREQLLDLARLDFSIARLGFSTRLRRRLRASLTRPAELDSASRAFVRDFLRGRSRRELRLGERWQTWRPKEDQAIGGERAAVVLDGLKDREVPPAALDRALAASKSDPRPADRGKMRVRVDEHDQETRRMIVKRTTLSSKREVSAARLRGSPAYRAFKRGQRLALLGSLGPRPLAALDERRGNDSITSWLILEHVGEIDLADYRPSSPEDARRCCVELASWLAEWHAWGIDHLDLKASNIRMSERDEEFRFWLIDLGDLRFRRRVHDKSRLRALVQLNASLPDDAFSLAAREAALDEYLERLPFTTWSRRETIEAIVRRSLERAHRWNGTGCRIASDRGA